MLSGDWKLLLNHNQKVMLKILPVIHHVNSELSMSNAAIAFAAGSDGVFVISMDGNDAPLCDAARQIKEKWPDKFVGVNHLTMAPADSMRLNLAARLDGTWSDYAMIRGKTFDERAAAVRDCRPQEHQFFASVAFKYQAKEQAPAEAALCALSLGFIPTTSGSATGKAARIEKLQEIRNGIGDGSLAIASGITPENIETFAPFLTHILVATGVSLNFDTFCTDKMSALMSKAADFR